MKNKNIWIIVGSIIIGIGIIIFTMYLIDMERMEHNYDVVFSTWGRKYAPPVYSDEENNEEQILDIVEIKNGNISDEALIEKFIEEANSEATKEKTLIIREYINENEYIEKKLTFNPYIAKCKEEENENTVQVNIDEFKKKQGKFALITYYNFSKEKYADTATEINAFDYILKRKVEEGIVKFYFDTLSSLTEELSDSLICSYSLESSNYEKNINLNFYQRKDLGLKTINNYDKYDFNIYTYGGDVSFTFDTDMVYIFETALEEDVVTVENILNQAREDAKYGICKEGYYSDGGSTEYLYDDYTILKFDTLDGRKDLVIGIKGQIINKVDDILVK